MNLFAAYGLAALLGLIFAYAGFRAGVIEGKNLRMPVPVTMTFAQYWTAVDGWVVLAWFGLWLCLFTVVAA